MAMYVWLCIHGYVCMAMYSWLCMHGYVCIAMYSWLCVHGYVCMTVNVCMAMYICFVNVSKRVYTCKFTKTAINTCPLDATLSRLKNASN